MKNKNSKRLDSIKAAHEVEKTRSSSRMEDYLEIIGELVELKGYATTLDISRYMNVSAPSVTKMLQRLDEGGFLEYEKYHGINLTKKGIQVAEGIRENAPNAFVICITNPLDVMVMAFQKFSGLSPNKVVGMAGILDSSRFKLFLSEEFSVPVKEIEAMVMGGHGDTMVPLPRFTKVSGKPLLDLVKEGKISQKRLEEINQRTRDGGAEIVKFLEKGSAFYAPAASGVEMATAYLRDEKKLLPCAAYLNGEYGINDIYAGVPIIVGKNGVEKIEEINLDEKEKSEFLHSIDAVKKLWEAASKIDADLNK